MPSDFGFRQEYAELSWFGSVAANYSDFTRHCCPELIVSAMSISFYLKVREPSFDLGSSFISSSFPICLCLLLLNF